MRKVLCRLLLFGIALSLGPEALEATTARLVSTPELAARSERIVTGRCVATRVQWMGRILVTLATFEVEETLKGEQAASLTVALPGGIDLAHRPPVQVLYAGAPQLFAGQEALLFLRPSTELGGLHVLVGFSQGLFAITGGPAGELGSRDLGELTLVDGNGRAVRGTAESVELAALRSEIAAGLARTASEVVR